MSSLRVLTNLVAKDREAKYLLVEWEEVGQPHSIVNGNCVVGSGLIDSSCVCSGIEVKIGARFHPALVLGVGSKAEMETLQDRLECDKDGWKRPGKKRKHTVQKGKPKKKKVSQAALVEKENRRMNHQLLEEIEKEDTLPITTPVHSSRFSPSPKRTPPNSTPVSSPIFSPPPPLSPIRPQPNSLISPPLQSITFNSPVSPQINLSPVSPEQTISQLHISPFSRPQLKNLFTDFEKKIEDLLDTKLQPINSRMECIESDVIKKAIASLKKEKQQLSARLSEQTQIFQTTSIDEDASAVANNQLGRWMGNQGSHSSEGKKIFVPIATKEKATNVDSVLACIPSAPEKLALKLLGAFFKAEELARSNCTKVEGRELLGAIYMFYLELEASICFSNVLFKTAYFHSSLVVDYNSPMGDRAHRGRELAHYSQEKLEFRMSRLPEKNQTSVETAHNN